MKYVIIGGSAAGVNACESIRKKDRDAEIVLISDEREPLYSRCLLTYLVAGSVGRDKIYFKDKDFYKRNKVITHLGNKVISIDRRREVVVLQDKTKLPYDRLLLATGGVPKSIDIPGVDKKGVFTIRKLEDAESILDMLDGVKTVCILGGGLVGLRAAYALHARNKNVKVIVKSRHILSQMVDEDAAGVIADVLKGKGIEIMTNLAAREITGKKHVEGVILDNGKEIPCQLIIIGKGVKPRIDLASDCGLQVGNGIIVNEYLKTNDANIFAAGDVAETTDIVRETKRINALWVCAVEQGKVAGANMTGEKNVYDGSLSMNSIDFFGLASISMGIIKPEKKEGLEIISRRGETSYKKFILKDGKIIGAILVGDIRGAGVVNCLMRAKVDISSIKDILFETRFDYARIMSLIREYKGLFKQEEFKDTLISWIV